MSKGYVRREKHPMEKKYIEGCGDFVKEGDNVEE